MPNDEEQFQNRRSSDTMIYQMSNQIGELKGSLEAFAKNQETLNTSMAKLHEKADVRLESLEKTRTRLFAAAAVSGVGSGGILAAIKSYLHIGS